MGSSNYSGMWPNTRVDYFKFPLPHWFQHTSVWAMEAKLLQQKMFTNETDAVYIYKKKKTAPIKAKAKPVE